MDKSNFLGGGKTPDSTGGYSSKSALASASIMSFSVSGRNTNNSNNAAFSATTAVTTSIPRAHEINNPHGYHHHHYHHNNPHNNSGSSSNNHNSFININEEENVSSDISEEVDFDRPSGKNRKKPKKHKSKCDITETSAAAAAEVAAVTAAAAAEDDNDNDDDEDDDDNDEDRSGGAAQRRGYDADSVGSPKTPGQTPTPADPDTELEPDSTVKRTSKSGSVKQQKLSNSAKLLLDKKRLEQYVGEGEVLVPVPRARRRLKGGDLGYMVKKGDTVVRYIDKDGIIYKPFR